MYLTAGNSSTSFALDFPVFISAATREMNSSKYVVLIEVSANANLIKCDSGLLITRWRTSYAAGRVEGSLKIILEAVDSLAEERTANAT